MQVERKVSTRCEVYGVDFLWANEHGLHGAQRKTVSDLLASVADGRLQRELGQMGPLASRFLILEGSPSWTNGGEIMGYGSRWTVRQWTGMLASLGATARLITSSSIQQTTVIVDALYQWTMSTKHTSLVTRPGATGAWGKPSNKEYQIHLVQGLPGVGIELATRIVEKMGVPWQWKEGVEERLMEIDGIGKKKAKAIMEML